MKEHILNVYFYECVLFSTSLYVFGALVGVALGALQKYCAEWAFKFNLTPVAPFDDVWTDILTSRFRTKENRRRSDKEKDRVWLQIAFENTEYIGCLSRASAIITNDAHFEIFLDPAYEVRFGKTSEITANCPALSAYGVYLRVPPATPIKIFSGKTDALSGT